MKRKKAYRGKLYPLVFKRNILPFTLLFLLLSLITHAQQPGYYRLQGQVFSSSNNTPLPGATVQVKGSRLGTTTGEDGTFTLIIADSSITLLVSFLGYKAQELDLRLPLTNPLTIVLKQDVAQLEEVVVSTGYETIPKERATGSFATPVSNVFNDRVSTDVISRLNNITSGLRFNRDGTMNVRGRSTIFANEQPLIVVDNFPYSGDISNINPNDVKSITVLRDAAAASIWGARAGNGVIVITTKKGSTHSTLDVFFTSNITVHQKPDLYYSPDYFNVSDYIDIETFLYRQGKYTSDFTDKTYYPVISPVVHLLHEYDLGNIDQRAFETQMDHYLNRDVRKDILEYFYREAIYQQNALSFSGGNKKTTYFFSFGYDKNLYHLRDNENSRLTLNTLNTFSPLSKLTFSVGVNYIQNNHRLDNTLSTTTNGLGFTPYSRFADETGEPLPVYIAYDRRFVDEIAPEAGFMDWSYYPLNELGLTNNQTKVNDIRINSSIKYTIFKGLNLEGRYQYQKYNSENSILNGQNAYYTRDIINRFSIVEDGLITGYNVPMGNILNVNNSGTVAHNSRIKLSYNNKWKQHDVNFLAGFELMEVNKSGNSRSLYGYNDNVATFQNINSVTRFPQNPSGAYSYIPTSTGVSGGIDRFRSVFGNGSYTYKGKYTLSVSARIDGSNYFGVETNQKNVPLWSAGFKWDLDKEPFYRISWLPHLRLRATYGYSGNLERGITGVTTFLYRTNSPLTALPYARISNIGNPELRWEKIAIANFGLEFKTNNSLFSGSFEYFHKKGTDLIGDAVFAPSTGINSLRGNYSQIKGQGVDVELTASLQLGKALDWNSTLLFSYATDKVTRYDVPSPNSLTYVATNYPVEGKPVYSLFSYRWAGLDPLTGDPQGYSEDGISKDYNTLLMETAVSDLVFHGPTRAPFFGGFINHFKYKGISLGFNIGFKLGHYFRRPSLSYSQLFEGKIIGNNEYDQRWRQPGHEQRTTVPSLQYPANRQRDQFYQYSEITVEKAGYIRLQDINLGYTFSRNQFPRIPFENIEIYLYANNLGLLWTANRSGYDPDFIPHNSDYFTAPLARSIAFGIKADL